MTVYHTTLRGTINTGSLGEIFSHSLGIESAAPVQEVAEDLRDAWSTTWNNLKAYFNTSITYTEATAAQVLDPMVPDLGAAFHATFIPPLAGTSSVQSLPSQCATAVSLTAGNRPNGQPFRGRFYLPPFESSIVGQDGLLPSTMVANLTVYIQNFFQLLAANLHYASIWSRTVEDLVRPVNLVRVGNKVDTIRSRRNRFPETYSSQPVAGPQ